MERNMNRGIAISEGCSRALYCDLGEMFGLCLEGHVHLSQNTSDVDRIAMPMCNEHIEIVILIVLFVEVCVCPGSWRRRKVAGERGRRSVL